MKPMTAPTFCPAAPMPPASAPARSHHREDGLGLRPRTAVLVALLTVLGLSACDGTYVDYRRETIDDPILIQRGTEALAAVCHRSPFTPRAELDRMGRDFCARRGQRAEFKRTALLGCSVSHPYITTYDCVGPVRNFYREPEAANLQNSPGIPQPPPPPYATAPGSGVPGAPGTTAGSRLVIPDARGLPRDLEPIGPGVDGGWEEGIWGQGGLPDLPSY
ncbi:MAG: hypothetical protein ACPGOY_18805 [Rhodospirillaceae bacterium]